MTWIRLDIDYDRTDWLRKEKRAVKDAWPNLLRLVKREAPNKASIRYRGIEDLAYVMRYEDDELWVLEALLKAAQSGDDPAILINSGYLTILHWSEYQSADAERVRNKRSQPDDSENVTDKPDLLRTNGKCREQTDSVTDSADLLRNSHVARDQATKQQDNKQLSHSRAEQEIFWDRFFAVFPKRGGHNGKSLGKKKFFTLLASGVDPEVMIAGAARYLETARESGSIGTPFVAQIPTWLHQRRFEDDYLPIQPRAPATNGHYKPKQDPAQMAIDVIRDMENQARNAS